MVRQGYFPMTLVRVPKNWKRGGEALEIIPNGEYDYFMCEQKGIFTAPRVLREMLLNRLDEIKRIAKLERRMDSAEGDIKQIIVHIVFVPLCVLCG